MACEANTRRFSVMSFAKQTHGLNKTLGQRNSLSYNKLLGKIW